MAHINIRHQLLSTFLVTVLIVLWNATLEPAGRARSVQLSGIVNSVRLN